MLNWISYNWRPMTFGALLMGLFVGAWPLIPLSNQHYTLTIKNDSAAERHMCDVYSSTVGTRLLPEKSRAGKAPCTLLVYGHYDFSGNFVVAHEMRNPFDVKRYLDLKVQKYTIPSKSFAYSEN